MATSNDGTSVIIADDDSMIRGVLRHKLEAIDQIVYQASDGIEALEFASRIQAKLIMLDLNMPRLNGLLVCQRIREMPNHAQTPIVILTSIRGKDAEDALVRVGATAFLTKPFRSAELMQVLSRYLTISAVTRNAIRQNADKVGDITKTVAISVADARLAKDEPVNTLDWGKTILAKLRG